MNSDYGVFKLVKEASGDQWREGAIWLLYTLIGVALPIVFVYLGRLWRYETISFLTLFSDGELFIYSASFWVYALYELDKSKLRHGLFKTIPYIAIGLISFSFNQIQSMDVHTEGSGKAMEQIVIFSMFCFAASIVISYFGNLISRSKAALEGKARISDIEKVRKDHRTDLARKFQETGGGA